MRSSDTPPNGTPVGDGYWLMVIERLARIETQLGSISAGRDDHEDRLRKLEERKFPLPTISVIIAIAALGMTVLTYLSNR